MALLAIWPLYITPYIIMICIDMQGGGTPLPRRAGVIGNSLQAKNNQPIEMRAFSWQIAPQGLVSKAVTDVLIGRFPIGALFHQ
jgi:hypothetical protein